MTAPRVPGGNPADPFPIVNDALDILAHQQVYGWDPDTTGGLNLGYLGGRWGGFPIADGVLVLADDAVNHVVVERATGLISSDTAVTNWDNLDEYARVWMLETADGQLTTEFAEADYRGGPGGVHGGGGGGGGGGGSGDVVGPGASTDNALPRFNGTSGNILQSSGVLLSDDDELSGYKANLNQQTGTTYTLQASDSGKIVELTNASAISLTAANSLPKGFNCTIVQGGAGQVTVASSGSGSVVNRQSQFKTAGQNAMCSIYVRSNSGTNAVYVFGGDTAA